MDFYEFHNMVCCDNFDLLLHCIQLLNHFNNILMQLNFVFNLSRAKPRVAASLLCIPVHLIIITQWHFFLHKLLYIFYKFSISFYKFLLLLLLVFNLCISIAIYKLGILIRNHLYLYFNRYVVMVLIRFIVDFSICSGYLSFSIPCTSF